MWIIGLKILRNELVTTKTQEMILHKGVGISSTTTAYGILCTFLAYEGIRFEYMYKRIKLRFFSKTKSFNLYYVHRLEPPPVECRRWRRLGWLGGEGGTMGKCLSLLDLNSRERRERFIGPVPADWAGGGPSFSGGGN